MAIQCVVTGQDTSGKSVFVRDAPVAPVTLALLPGFEFHRLWGSESVVQLPSNGTAPPHPGYFPPKADSVLGFSPYHLRQIRKSHLLIWLPRSANCGRNCLAWPKCWNPRIRHAHHGYGGLRCGYFG